MTTPSTTLVSQVAGLAQRNGTLSNAERGLLNTLLERHVNVNSDPTMKWFLYGQGAADSDAARRIPTPCRFPAQFKRGGLDDDGRPAERSVTKNVEALLSLYRSEQRWVCAGPGGSSGPDGCATRNPADRKTCQCCKAPRGAALLLPDRRIELVLEMRALLTRRSQAGCRLQRDGRIRNSVNIAATESFRHATYALELRHNDSFGFSLHTTPESLKHLILADEGHWLGSIDLSGADSWTVACEAKALGDDTMLNDLQAGIKPAQAIGLMHLHGPQVNSWPYERMRAALPEVKSVPWLYPAVKACAHLSAYGGGPRQVQLKILKESYRKTGTPLFVPLDACERLQGLVHLRYRGIRWRIDWVRSQLLRHGCIETPAGCRRVFFGRRGDSGTEREALATSPQVTTTYATELAWRNMWFDETNWLGTVGEGDPHCAPLLLVHDSILFSFAKERTAWVRERIPAWFGNTITIAGTTVTIPHEASYGPSWGKEGRQTLCL